MGLALLCLGGWSSSAEAALRWEGLTLEGFVDAGVVYQRTIATSTDAYTWQINEIELGLTHEFSERASVRLAINYLKTTSTFDGLTLLDNMIQEAFVRFALPLGKGFRFYTEIGRFYAPPGWDAVNTADRYQASASWAQLATPNTFTGLKFGFQSNWMDVYATLVNGWDTIEEVDTQPTVGLAASFSVGPTKTTVSVSNGRETGASTNPAPDERSTLLDAHLTLTFLQERLILALEGYLLLHPSGQLWYGWLFAVHCMPIRWIGGTVRYSRFADPTGLTNPAADNDEISVALLSRPLQPLLFLAEYRVDLQNGSLLTHTVAAKAIYRF